MPRSAGRLARSDTSRPACVCSRRLELAAGLPFAPSVDPVIDPRPLLVQPLSLVLSGHRGRGHPPEADLNSPSDQGGKLGKALDALQTGVGAEGHVTVIGPPLGGGPMKGDFA